MGQAEAQKFLKMAQEHLERVQVASGDDPTDWPDLTIFGFYCVEAAVMAAAESNDTRDMWAKYAYAA